MGRSLSILAFAGALLTGVSPAAAAVDAFLQIEGINGQSVARPGWIEVNSFQWGVGRGISSPTGGASDRESSAPSVSEITITRSIDKATPLLSKCAATGCHYGKVVLAVRKAGAGEAYDQYILSNAMISSYHASSGGDRPMESLSFSFARIERQTPTAGGMMTSGGAVMPPPGRGATAPASAGLPPPGPAATGGR
jgi:type VI secretion system secreted protein Hcp